MNLSNDPPIGGAYSQPDTRQDHTPSRFSESNTLEQSRQSPMGNLYTESPESPTTSHSHPDSGHQRQVSFLSWVSRAGSPNSSKNSSGTFCRICHDGELSERFISPCQCSGSVGLVHRSCIEKWLSTANHDNCEICGHKFSISKHPRPFVQWICEPTGQDDQRNLIGDIICFLLLTPLATISAYLCATGARAYLKDKWSEAVGLICLSVFLVLIYMFWVLLTIRYHWQVWSLWQDSNQDIRLVETEAPVMRTRPSAETVVSHLDLGSRDASINMDTNHDDNKGSHISVNSASALLNDHRNSYFPESSAATQTFCHRESMSASVYKDHVHDHKLETPNDGSFVNQSVVDISLDEETLAMKDAGHSRRNSDSYLLGVASSCETFATAESIVQESPIASSTPGNVERNLKRSISSYTTKRSISSCSPRQTPSHVLNPPNQYLHPINTFLPQRTTSQPNLANTGIYTVCSIPHSSPEELRNSSSKFLKQTKTPLHSVDSLSECETLPPYPSTEFIDVPRTSFVSLLPPTSVLDSDLQPTQLLDSVSPPGVSSDSDASSDLILDSIVIHGQTEVGDVQTTPILDNERPPNPPLSPNITIESPKQYYSNAAKFKLPLSTACVSAYPEEENEVPTISTSNGETRLFRTETGGTEV